MKDKEALEKLDHTLCLNSLLLRFSIDNDYHIDCKDADEMVDCIETLQEALEQKEKQDKILEILKKCEDDKHSLYYVYVLNALSSGKITQDDAIKVKEWLNGNINQR